VGRSILEELERFIPRIIDATAPKIIKWLLIWILIKLVIALIILGVGAIVVITFVSSIKIVPPSEPIYPSIP